MQFTDEQLKKAAACESVDELKDFAVAEGINLTDDEAQACFDKLNPLKLTDEELDEVAGGLAYDFTSIEEKKEHVFDW